MLVGPDSWRRSIVPFGILTLCTACSREVMEDVGQPDIGRTVAGLEIRGGGQIIDRDGKRYILRKRNVRRVDPPKDRHITRRSRGDETPIKEMSVVELAEALRPVMLVGNDEYILETPDEEFARKVISDLRTNKRFDISRSSYGTEPSPDQHTSSHSKKHFCCGADERVTIRNNTDWPFRTTIAMATPPAGQPPSWATAGPTCTMQLIGPSTALSAAHCFGNFSGWFPLAMWGAGPDGQDPGGPIPAGYPQDYGCYWVDIPWQYWVPGAGGPGSQWDFASIDFRNLPTGCNETPGNIVGWVRWANLSGQFNSGWAHGVPGLTAMETPEPFYPQIKNMFIPTALETPQALIRSTNDSNKAQSGQAFFTTDPSNGLYTVAGTHHGHWGSSTVFMQERVLDATVANWIILNTEY